MNSDTEICNQALAHLGERPIASLNDDSAAARACQLLYIPTRDEWLRSHRWNFAVTRTKLSRLADNPPFGWDFQYQLPEDYLRALEVNDSEAGDWVSDEWIIEGRRLLTNAPEVNFVYIKKVTDVSDFDSLFAQALALKLAIKLSEAIRGTTNKSAELTTMFERMSAPLARRIDANEGRRRKGLLPMNSLALRARKSE